MKEKSTKLTDLLALLVFAVFALCVLLVLLSGAKVYRELVSRGEASFESRTAVQYVTTRVRQAEAVTVGDFDGCQALVIPEEIDGEIYLTRVYCHDGYIRELFCAETAALSPEAGTFILPAEQLGFSLSDGILQITLDAQTLFLHME